MSDDHERFMSECLLLAELGKGQVSPNPLVGAVLVRDGRVVARGYHQRCGGPHAEMNCLAHYTGDVRSATMYVSLEPCSHHGKTPPCADMLSGSGLRHVVVGMKDPNPLVSGRGIERLRNAGVEVTVGVLEREARELNRVFVTHIRAKRPYVHVKIAQSMDGFIASPNARRRWISSAASRALVHRWRAEYDAVLVGAGTVIVYLLWQAVMRLFRDRAERGYLVFSVDNFGGNVIIVTPQHIAASNAEKYNA